MLIYISVYIYKYHIFYSKIKNGIGRILKQGSELEFQIFGIRERQRSK